jgi:hypothetical protein
MILKNIIKTSVILSVGLFFGYFFGDISTSANLKEIAIEHGAMKFDFQSNDFTWITNKSFTEFKYQQYSNSLTSNYIIK